MQPVRVYPRLRACFGRSFAIMGMILGLLAIVDLIKGRLSWDKMRVAISVVLVVGGGLGLLFYLIGRVFATLVDETGFRGPNFLGVRRTIAWDDIGSVQRMVVEDMPYLLIRARSSKKEVWFCTLGMDEAGIIERLKTLIPPDAISGEDSFQSI